MNKLKTIMAAGMKGINSDVAPWDLGAEFITDGENFRIQSDKIESTGSVEAWSQCHVKYNYDVKEPATFRVPTDGELLRPLDGGSNVWHLSKTDNDSNDNTDNIDRIQAGDIIRAPAFQDVFGNDLPPVAQVSDLGTHYTITFGGGITTGVTGVQQIASPYRFEPAHLHFVPSSIVSEFWMVLGSDNIFVYDGGTTPEDAWYNISSTAYSLGVNGEYDWSSCQIGSIPVVNNPNHFPEYWSPQSPATALQALPFDATYTFATRPVPIQGACIRSHKNYMFLLDLTEGGTDLPSSYRWSHPADNNAIPVSWDETDVNFIAGKAQLGGDSGRLLDGMTMRDSFVLYSEYAVNILDESFDELVWRRRTLSTTAGLLNRSSLVEAAGMHYFIGDGDIYRNDGNTVKSIIHGRMKKRFNSRANGDYFHRSYAVRYTAQKEIWFCIPEAGSTHPDTAFVYNWRDDSWAIQKIPNTVAHAAYGSQVVPPVAFEDYGDASFDSLTNVPFDSSGRTPLNQNVIGVCNATSCLQILDPQITQDTALESFIQREGLSFEGNREVTTINRIYPHVDSEEPVNISVGSQMHIGAPISWKPAVSFDPHADRKIDVRTTGIFHSWRIESINTGMFEFTGMDFEYANTGKR